jgi:hypothetical protein
MQHQSLCIFLNSKTANSYVNNYTSECLFRLPPLNIPKKSKINISIQTASIPSSFYNCDDFNNKFNIVVNGINQNYIIPQGNYNINTLIIQLKALMGINFSISFNSLDNTITFSNTSYDFQFLSSSTCFEMLGFVDNISYVSISKVLKSTISINLFTIRNILISSNNFILNNINSNKPNDTSILCSIPINSSAGSIISYSNSFNVSNDVYNTTNLTLLHIKLTDQDGALLDLNGCHFSLTLQLDIYKK